MCVCVCVCACMWFLFLACFVLYLFHVYLENIYRLKIARNRFIVTQKRKRKSLDYLCIQRVNSKTMANDVKTKTIIREGRKNVINLLLSTNTLNRMHQNTEPELIYGLHGFVYDQFTFKDQKSAIAAISLLQKTYGNNVKDYVLYNPEVFPLKVRICLDFYFYCKNNSCFKILCSTLVALGYLCILLMIVVFTFWVCWRWFPFTQTILYNLLSTVISRERAAVFTLAFDQLNSYIMK
jgi:hypothetical protein